MRTRSLKHFSADEYERQFQAWKRDVWEHQKLPYDVSELTVQIRAELAKLRSMSASDYELLRKWHELQEFKGKYTPERLNEVYARIWKPSGYSDFRRIDPELIYVKETVKSRKVDIWGNVSEHEWKVSDPLAEDWDILRTLVSRHRNSGVIGRQYRYLVRDRGTKRYIGVICISGDMLEPKGRDAIIGWTKDQKLKTQPHCANGSTIVPLQPFGSAFNGGKLLSLLCLSDEVAERWFNDTGADKKHYRLVHVMTTSLFGNEGKSTMYDNLEPYWTRTSAETSGDTQYELSPDLERSCLDWLKVNEPRIHFDHFVAKKCDGTPKIRDPKDKALKKVFRLLGLKPSEYRSGHKRGMYLAPLYGNAYEFLRGEIAETDLVPKFNNSIPALTNTWQFELDATSSAKGRLDVALKIRAKGLRKGKVVKPLATYDQPFWYRDLMDMTWQEARAAFG